MKKALLLLASHSLVAVVGFGAGVYFLPILIAPPGPPVSEVSALASQARFTGEFRRDLTGSDALHWGEGTVSVGPQANSLMGRLAPGPDSKLYLSPAFVQTEAEFLPLKDQMLRVGDVKTFENFVVALPVGVDLAAYNTVVVWCETFKEFISAAQYR